MTNSALSAPTPTSVPDTIEPAPAPLSIPAADDGRNIRRTIGDGVAVLTGTVGPQEALHAQQAALHLPGVRAVAQEVQPWGRAEQADVRIAHQVAHALGAAPGVPVTVKATVHHGTVVLCGEVSTERERGAACRAVSALWEAGSVVNSMTVGAIAPSPS